MTAVQKVFKLFSGHGWGRFALVRRLREWVHLLSPETAEVHGHKMVLDPFDSLNLAGGNPYEPLQTQWVSRNVKSGDVAVDIGANIGYYTLLLAKLVGEKGKVFAFEPEPRNFQLLKRNVEMNGYKNVTLIPKAVSDKAGKIRLHLCKSNKGMHSVYKTSDHGRMIQAETVVLDDYFKKFPGKIDFVKIDVEGSEPEVIRGMTGILGNNRNMALCLEFTSEFKSFGADPEAPLKRLEELGFRLHEIDEDKGSIDPVTRKDLLEKCTVENKEYTNLLCLRGALRGEGGNRSRRIN